MATIAITAANVLSTGARNNGVIAAGVTVTQGQALYTLANGTLGLADANGSPPANSFAGFSLTAGSPGQPVVFVTLDSAYVCGGTLTVGGVVWLDSTTPGAITQTYSDVASGSTVITLGIATSTTAMNLSAVVGGVKP